MWPLASVTNISVTFGARETDTGEPRQAPGIRGVEAIRGTLMTRMKTWKIEKGDRERALLLIFFFRMLGDVFPDFCKIFNPESM